VRRFRHSAPVFPRFPVLRSYKKHAAFYHYAAGSRIRPALVFEADHSYVFNLRQIRSPPLSLAAGNGASKTKQTSAPSAQRGERDLFAIHAPIDLRDLSDDHVDWHREVLASDAQIGERGRDPNTGFGRKGTWRVWTNSFGMFLLLPLHLGVANKCSTLPGGAALMLCITWIRRENDDFRG